jgi:hypothetical protein
MSIGWVTDVAAANTHFLTKRFRSPAWDALVVASGGRDEKTAVLNMAYDRLRFCVDFDEIPATPTAAQLEKLQLAQYETAYYLAQHLADEDLRKGIQAQGVKVAGIVNEQYADVDLSELPLPPIVFDLMAEFSSAQNAKPFYAIEIGRDENKDIDEDVTDD